LTHFPGDLLSSLRALSSKMDVPLAAAVDSLIEEITRSALRSGCTKKGVGKRGKA